MGCCSETGRWMARDISMNTKARNVSDAGRVARRKEVKIERAIERTSGGGATVLHRSRNVEASRIGSRVRSIVNHGGSREKKLPFAIASV